MNILKDVFTELFSMFVADARLTAAILATIALAAAVIKFTSLPPLAGGLVLLLGCILVLFFSVKREATCRASAPTVFLELCKRLTGVESTRPEPRDNHLMRKITLTDRLRTWARKVKRDVVALYLAARDPRVPWLAKVVSACVVAYALSPIDLIPDFIPVVGYLDEAILVPLGIRLAIRLVPADVMTGLRVQADTRGALPKSRAAAIAVVAVWLMASNGTQQPEISCDTILPPTGIYPNYAIVMDGTQSRDARLVAYYSRDVWDFALHASGRPLSMMIEKFGQMGVVERRDGPPDDPDFPPVLYVLRRPQDLLAGLAGVSMDAASLSDEARAARTAGWAGVEDHAFFLRARHRTGV